MAPRRPPWGKRQQTEVTHDDDMLCAVARQNHPTCAWWYGRGRTGADKHLVCYICDTTLLPTSPPYALGVEGVRVVMEHRAYEIERARPKVLSTVEDS